MYIHVRIKFIFSLLSWMDSTCDECEDTKVFFENEFSCVIGFRFTPSAALHALAVRRRIIKRRQTTALFSLCLSSVQFPVSSFRPSRHRRRANED